MLNFVQLAGFGLFVYSAGTGTADNIFYRKEEYNYE